MNEPRLPDNMPEKMTMQRAIGFLKTAGDVSRIDFEQSRATLNEQYGHEPDKLARMLDLLNALEFEANRDAN